MTDDSERQPRFQVKDRRRFSDSGEARPDADPEARTGASRPTSPPGAPDPAPADRVTFSSFVLGLSTQALCHLGEIPNPTTGGMERDLAAAREVIDILGMLRDKTRNNLEQAEDTLLDSVLFDLRMRYVELVRSVTKEGT
jgi:hypothetical protein